MPMSIAPKVTLVVSILAALLLVGAGYTGLMLRKQETQQQLRRQARLISGVLKLSAEASLQNYGQLGALEDFVSRDMGAAITFYNRDGQAIAPVPTEERPVVNARVLRVMDRNQPEEEVFAGGYAYWVPLIHNNKVAGALELRLDLVNTLPAGWPFVGWLAATVLLVLFAVIIGLFSRRAIGKPIEHLMKGIDHVIQGDLAIALPLEQNDEIGRIAYRFNEMTAQLRDAQEEIRSGAESKLLLEQRLRQSEKLATIGQLSAEIAHEVGTPLNVISVRARTLERKAEQPDEVLKNSRIIAEQADRITKIIQHILNLARARIPQKIEVDLSPIIQATLSVLEYQIEHSSVEVCLHLDQTMTKVSGDADGLQQVFINLILNAIQAMEKGGKLKISSRVEHRRKEGLNLTAPETYIAVEISDTGPGIPPTQQSQIFEPFFSTKPRGKGTGLGLTVVHGIVKEHDGWIEVESPANQGTTFRIYLPASEAPSNSLDINQLKET